MIYNFQDQIKVGEKGEAWLCEAFPDEFIPQTTPEKSRVFDIWHASIRSHGPGVGWPATLTCEVKTDTRALTTGNLFWELGTVQDSGKSKPGGPWRALQDGVESFVVILWGKDGPVRAALWTDLRRLVVSIDMYVGRNQLPIKRVFNAGYQGIGYAVPKGAITPDKVYLAKGVSYE